MAQRWFRLLIGLAIAVLGLIGVVPLGAQEQPASGPVVYGVFFFLPTCPHCHNVIQNDIPQWEQEFGDSFVLLAVDVSQPGGENLYSATCYALNIPDSDCGTVPVVVIGETALFGDRDIPDQVPDLVREGLAQGGIDLPPVPELQAAYAALLATPGVESTATVPTETGTIAEATEIVVTPSPTPIVVSTTGNSTSDLTPGNAIAVVTLLGLVASLGLIWQLAAHGLLTEAAQPVVAAIIFLTIAATIIAGTLVAGDSTDDWATISAWGILGLLLVGVLLVGVRRSNAGMIPLITLAGLLAAVYLTHVEASTEPTACKIIAGCDAVQTSKYARIFGVSIGLIGIFGYGAILVAWALALVGKNRRWSDYVRAALLGMTLFGVVFSIYLTFLEPFVIGATCAWCITSALTMLLLLWLTAPAGWSAWCRLRSSGAATETATLPPSQ